MGKSRFAVPEGWLQFENYGNTVQGTRIIPLKTPLESRFHVPSGKEFTVAHFLEDQKEKFNRDIGAILDLTNTEKYYHPEELPKNVQHIKLPVDPYNKKKESKEINYFVKTVDEFHKKNPKKYIGVHCTHGINRTGFMIACYLVEMKGLNVTEALKLFSDSRPPGVYKPDIIVRLYVLYGFTSVPEFINIKYPEPPPWVSEKKYNRSLSQARRLHRQNCRFSKSSSSHSNQSIPTSSETNDDKDDDLTEEEMQKKSVEFLYEAPPEVPQYQEKPEDVIPDLPENTEARKFLAKAPTKGLWMPLGKEVKVMQCWRCKQYGHRAGDKDCPLYKTGNIASEAERRVREDPMAMYMKEDMKKKQVMSKEKMERLKQIKELLAILAEEEQEKKLKKKREKKKKRKKKKKAESSSSSSSSDSSSSDSSDSASSSSESERKKKKTRKDDSSTSHHHHHQKKGTLKAKKEDKEQSS